MLVGLLVKSRLYGHFLALFHLVSSMLLLDPRWPPDSPFECSKITFCSLIDFVIGLKMAGILKTMFCSLAHKHWLHQ